MSPTPDPHTSAEALAAPEAEREHQIIDDAGRDMIDSAEEERSHLAVAPDPSLAVDATPDGQAHGDVEWVRASDLATRAGGAIIGRGMELNAQLHDAIHDALRTQREQLRQRLATRDAELEPATQDRPHVAAAAREGVSR